MSDRTDKQRGYQDDRPAPRQGERRDGVRRSGEDGAGSTPRRGPSVRRARRPVRAAFRLRARRTRICPAFARSRAAPAAATLVDGQIFSRSKCPKCQQDLRSCAQCVSFDPGARFECAQTISARISPKDAANECPLLLGAHELGARDLVGAQSQAIGTLRRAKRPSTTSSSCRAVRQTADKRGWYNREMSLLSAQDEQVLTGIWPRSKSRSPWCCLPRRLAEARAVRSRKQVLDEVARLNDKITVVEKNFVLDTEDRAKYGIDKSPAIVILSDGQDTRMRMFGAPTGYEFVGLVEAILIAGTGKLELEDDTLKLLATVDQPTTIQVFSTPDLTPLSQSGRSGAQDGVRESPHHVTRDRGDRVHGFVAEVPCHRRSQNNRERDDRDYGGAARRNVRPRRTANSRSEERRTFRNLCNLRNLRTDRSSLAIPVRVIPVRVILTAWGAIDRPSGQTVCPPEFPTRRPSDTSDRLAG